MTPEKLPDEYIAPGEIIERPSATFTAIQVVRLYRMEHAGRMRNPCTPGHPMCVACKRADELLAKGRP